MYNVDDSTSLFNSLILEGKITGDNIVFGVAHPGTETEKFWNLFGNLLGSRHREFAMHSVNKNSRLNNSYSETPHRSFWSYIVSMEFLS